MVEIDLRRTLGDTHQLLRQLFQEEDDFAKGRTTVSGSFRQIAKQTKKTG